MVVVWQEVIFHDKGFLRKGWSYRQIIVLCATFPIHSHVSATTSSSSTATAAPTSAASGNITTTSSRKTTYNKLWNIYIKFVFLRRAIEKLIISDNSLGRIFLFTSAATETATTTREASSESTREASSSTSSSWRWSFFGYFLLLKEYKTHQNNFGIFPERCPTPI